MKNVVMGTAGHIDHGKTALVKKLTDIDTDRLEEEKRRGMTIELGFAPLKLPSGNVISIVDVPGHEKFIKTMVSGVTGIDFVMLVIAADEGIMPQTREHIDILSLLNVKSGVIALTKIDLVDDAWLKMVKEDIEKELKGTFFEKCDIVPVSAITGEGIEILLKKLEELSSAAATTEPQEFFRMPIDRVFTIQGHGTVITGTNIGGKISKGESVSILPPQITTKIREIQVHNKKSETAYAGQRCAINISGIEKSEIKRGYVVTNEMWIHPINVADALLYTIKGNFFVKNNQRVHVNIGTKEVLARITIIGEDKITGGSKGYIQLRFEEPVVALRGDRFIVREFSPVVTLGGGIILSHITVNRRRFKEENIEALKIAEAGDMKALINMAMKSLKRPLSEDEIWHIVLGKRSEVTKTISEEINSKEIIALKSTNKYMNLYLSNDYLKKVDYVFNDLYKKYPFRFEIDKEELKSKIFNDLDIKDSIDILNYYIENNILILEKNKIRKNDDKIINNILKMKETKFIEEIILQYGLNIKTIDQIRKEVLANPNKSLINNYDDILNFLIRIDKIINLGNDIVIHRDILQESVNKIRDIFSNEKTMSAVFLRDYLNCSRKAAISILEYLDILGVTERQNDVRQPGVHYKDYFI